MSLCCLLSVASCASLPELPWAPVAMDAKAGFYESARIEYRLDAGKLGEPLSVARIAGRQVDYEQVASSPLADQTFGTLAIQYPHPAGLPDMARVTFMLESRRSDKAPGDSWNPLANNSPRITTAHEEVHEVWAMSIPRAESDRYFRMLSTSNFYHGAAVEDGPAELAVTIDGRQLRKTWRPLPELNALAQRVRREGQLVGYLRPEALVGLGTSGIASTKTYRELLARADTTVAERRFEAESAAPSEASQPRTAAHPGAGPAPVGR